MAGIKLTLNVPIICDGSEQKYENLWRLYEVLSAFGADEVAVVLNEPATVSEVKQVEPPPRGRGRPRKVTNGTDASAPVVKAEVTAPPADVAGDEPPDDEVEDLGLNGGGKTPAEAHGDAMGLVRSLYNAGFKEGIYKLRKKWNITKFDEIPLSEGHAFYKDVAVLAEQHGMHR